MKERKRKRGSKEVEREKEERSKEQEKTEMQKRDIEKWRKRENGKERKQK